MALDNRSRTINTKLCTSLTLAVYKGDLKKVKSLLNHPETKINEIDNQGQTAFTMAYLNGKEKIVEFLLKIPQLELNVDFIIKERYLINYACLGNMVVLELFLRRTEIPPNTDEALICAVYQNQIEEVKELFRILQPESKELIKTAILMIAAAKNYVEMMDFFIKVLKSPNHQNILGDTPLIVAVQNHCTEMLFYLVHNTYVALHQANYNHITPLYKACLEGHTDMVGFILNQLCFN